MKSLYRFVALPPGQRRLLVRAFLLVGVIRVGLWVLPFGRLQQWLSRSAKGPSPPAAGDGTYRQQVVWAVSAAGRRLLGDTRCLTEALAVQWLLHRKGYPTVLRIGVARDNTHRLRAHAWLESEGHIVIGGSASSLHYTPFPPILKAPQVQQVQALQPTTREGERSPAFPQGSAFATNCYTLYDQ